jgi:hypothetical protein
MVDSQELPRLTVQDRIHSAKKRSSSAYDTGRDDLAFNIEVDAMMKVHTL